MRPPLERTIEAYGDVWTLAEIAAARGVTTSAVRQDYRKGLRGEAIFRNAIGPEDSGVWRLGLNLGEWRRIREFAVSTTPKTAAQVYGVPEDAVRLAVESDWQAMENWEYLA